MADDIFNIAERLQADFPEMDYDSAMENAALILAASHRIDLGVFEAAVERDLAALPIREQENEMDDEMTLSERIDPRYLAHKILDQQDIIDEQARVIALHEQTIMAQDRKIAQLFRTNRVFAEALACTADRVDVPPLDETWRQERNGRWL